MERKKFDDDFLESEVSQKQEIKQNYDLDELRVTSGGACKSLFKKYESCKEIQTVAEKEMCEKLKKNLLECLKTSGKFYQ